MKKVVDNKISVEISLRNLKINLKLQIFTQNFASN